MSKIYKMIHCGNEYYVDDMGLRKYYFDMLVNDINERDFDTIEWLDETRDLDSQLDFIKFAKYGDMEDLEKNLKREESIEIREIKTYKEKLQFYVDYLNGKITSYYLYNNAGIPWKEYTKDMLLDLNNCKVKYAMSDYDILLALLDTKAYEIEDFKELFKQTFLDTFKEFEDFFEDFNTRIYWFTSGNDKIANVCENDSRNLDEFLHIFRKIRENL